MKIQFSKIDQKTFEDHKFKVRHILINHLDLNYHLKIIKLNDPLSMLKKLQEIKRCETNVTAQTVRKQLYNMQYIIGKPKAVEFCGKC